MLRLRNSRGQIAIPAMFLLPTLMMFVFLIYETAKLSRVKIRHQFAVDAASFVEMTNYSDFLNRSAYVNGAFPMRIFWEGFHDTELDCMGKTDCQGKKRLSEILYEDGVYPRSQTEPDPTAFNSMTDLQSWDIQYSDARASMNDDNPSVIGNAEKCGADCVVIVSMKTAKQWNINWEDANQIYKLYVQIYQLLGSVESAQYSVLKRLATQHNFLKKSYWLNVGGDTALAEADQLVSSFDVKAGGFMNAVKFHCAEKVYFNGNQLVHSWGQPYQIWDSDPPPTMPNTISDPSCTGLFQNVTVAKSMVNSMRIVNGGWPVEVRYALDEGNYFNVDLNTLMLQMDQGGPRVHATITIDGFGAKPAVWPHPTPKFQVRLYP